MQKLLGIDLTATPSTTAAHELGIEVDDVRGAQGVVTYPWYPNGQQSTATVTYNYAPSSRFRYVKAGGTITAGNAVRIDFTAAHTSPDYARQNTVIETSAADQQIEGIAMSSVTVGQYFWIMIHGFYRTANVATAAAAGDVLGSSSTAGRLATATPSAANAYATACGRGIRAVTAGSSNTADIFIQ